VMRDESDGWNVRGGRPSVLLFCPSRFAVLFRCLSVCSCLCVLPVTIYERLLCVTAVLVAVLAFRRKCALD
jgi:hypothetical protein